MKVLPPRDAPMPVLVKVGLGAVLGFLAPFFFVGYIPTSLPELRLVLLFGSVFGGSMAYCLHRYRHIERTRGGLTWTLLSGALAGGATGGIAYDLGYFTSVGHILLAVGVGAVLGGFAWLHGLRGP